MPTGQVGRAIEAGKFTCDRHLQHSHEGSIGQLCTAEIRQQMLKAVDSFPLQSPFTRPLKALLA